MSCDDPGCYQQLFRHHSFPQIVYTQGTLPQQRAAMHFPGPRLTKITTSRVPGRMTAYRGRRTGSLGSKTPSLACWGGALAEPGGQVATAAGPQGVDGPQDTAPVQLLVSITAAPVCLLLLPYGCSVWVQSNFWQDHGEFELVLGQPPLMIIARHLCCAMQQVLLQRHSCNTKEMHFLCSHRSTNGLVSQHSRAHPYFTILC